MASGQKGMLISCVCQKALINRLLATHSPNEMGGIYHFVSITILSKEKKHKQIFSQEKTLNKPDPKLLEFRNVNVITEVLNRNSPIKFL